MYNEAGFKKGERNGNIYYGLGQCYCNFSFYFRGLFLILGMVFLIVFGISLEKNTEGYPLTKISGGTYDVISVYDARDRVSLWIEKAENNKKKHLFFYQFPREAFVGGISEDAKYLVVTETDGFKRLQLQ